MTFAATYAALLALYLWRADTMPPGAGFAAVILADVLAGIAQLLVSRANGTDMPGWVWVMWWPALALVWVVSGLAIISAGLWFLGGRR